ncbi:hypothetical protein GUY61_36100, partial [Streptomyces sp. GC420]|nr:hypothetical protein [Streptomyces sp. GC420]
MRQLPSVPVRLAAAVLAVAVSAGCVSVGDDEKRPRPGHSSERRGGAARPDGGTPFGGGTPAGVNGGEAGGDSGGRHKGNRSAEPSEPGSEGPKGAKGGKNGKGGKGGESDGGSQGSGGGNP